ncbi:MAG: MFS transporter [Acetobacteraceae bacterium]|nr:MFS transporter [Acetobacteraceae bacterium]
MQAAPPIAPIALLATAGFLSVAGMRMTDPLLHVIASDLGTTVPALAVVVAAFTLPYGLCQIVLGPLGDRFGKLRVMAGALALLTLANIACALSGTVQGLTLARIAAGGASAAVVPLGMAYVADAVEYRERQVMLSRYLNGTVLAQVMAGPLGGVFGQFLGWRGVFLVLAAGTAAIAVTLARRMGRLADRRGGATFSLGNYLIMAASPVARVVLLAAMIDGTVLMGSFPFLAPYMHEAFGLPYAAVGLILACFGLGALVYVRLARWLVPLLGESRMVLLGGAMMAAAVAASVLLPPQGEWVAGLVAAQFAIGLGFYLLHGVLQARATEMLPHARATAVASFALMLFIGQSIGALAMGGLIAQFGYRGAFLCDAGAILVLGGWLAAVLRRR